MRVRSLDRSEVFSKKKVCLSSGFFLGPPGTSTSGGGFIIVVVSLHPRLWLLLSLRGGGVSSWRWYEWFFSAGGNFSLPHDPWLFFLDVLHRYTRKPMSKRKTMPATVPPTIPKLRVVDDPLRGVAGVEDGDAVTDVEGKTVMDGERAVVDVEGRRY